MKTWEAEKAPYLQLHIPVSTFSLSTPVRPQIWLKSIV